MFKKGGSSDKSTRQCKVVMLGDQAVGKSSIINRYIKNEFENKHIPTIGIDFLARTVSIGDKTIKLQLWDTAGQQRFRSLVPGYLRDAIAALIVFDLTNQNSFEQLGSWIEMIKQLDDVDPKIYIIANKRDLEDKRVVSSERLIDYASKEGVKFYEISARDGFGIKEMFIDIATDLTSYEPQKSPNKLYIKDEDDQEVEQSKCW